MTISKTWAKPELKQLSVDRTLGGPVNATFEGGYVGTFGDPDNETNNTLTPS